MSSTPKRARDLTPEQLSQLVMRRKQQRDAAAAATGEHGIARRGATSAPLTITFTNTSMMAQTATSLSIGGPNATEFGVVQQPKAVWVRGAPVAL